MNDRDDPVGTSGEDDSPYRPPPMVGEDGVVPPAGDRRPPLPIFLIAVYSFVASGLTALAMVVTAASLSSTMMLFAILGIPLLFLGVFSGLAVTAAGFERRSAAWKAMMVMLSAPVSMIAFVPTCTGATIPLIFLELFEVSTFVGCFAGYFVACYLIALYFHCRLLAERVRL